MKFTGRRIFIFLIAFFALTNTLFSQQNYYVSAIRGNDANSGTSSGSAWQTLTKLQTVIPRLQAGSKIFLERGSIWYNVNLDFSNIQGTAAAPIVVTAYGSGSEPVLSGGILVSSFQQNGNLWTKSDAAFPDITDDMKIFAGLYINDQLYLSGRMPNSGFYSTTTTGTTTYMDDYNVSWYPNQWQGGQVVARTVSWAYDKSYITSSDANSYNLEGFYYSLHKEETYYFLQNHINALDLNFEWAYSDHTLTVFSTEDINQKKIEVPVVEVLIEVTDCDYIHFENLHFTKANLSGLEINQSNFIEIRNCKISNIGSDGVKITESSHFKFENCSVFDCFSNAIKLDFAGITTIQNNLFKRIGIFPGAPNGNVRVGSTISSYIANQSVTVQYNRFDSVRMAYQQHWSSCPMYFQYNYITDYGMILGDIGAIYLEGESYGQYVKYVKNNIIVNGHSNLDSYYSRGTDAYPHAIYLDYDCSNVLIDSNTIITCNLGVLFNRVRNNTVQHNNIFNPGEYMVEDWRSAILWDGNTGVVFESLDNNNLINNQVVIDNDPYARGVLMHNAPLLGNTMDYNTYIIPFRDNSDIITTVQDYSDFTNFTLSEWYNTTGQESHSSYGHSSTHYDASLGVTEDEFVKTYYNPTASTVYQPLGAKYADRNGTVYDRGIYLPPYYSKFLFYYGPTDYPNHNPSIQPQSFYIEEQNPLPSYIGRIIASDPDQGQVLSYAITAGNSNNTFYINPTSGDLYLNVDYLDFQNIESFTLTVRVTDNGIPSLSSSAAITIYLTQDTVNYPPVINNQQFYVEYHVDPPALIGQILASDPNMGELLTYTITSGNSSNYFILMPGSGNLYFNTSAGEITDGNYSLVVRVTDNGSPALFTEADVTVALHQEMVNLPPVIENQDFRFFDVQGAGTFIGKVVASDPNNDAITFEILSGGGDMITIDSHTGELHFISEGPLFESNQLISLIIQVSDNGSPVELGSAFIDVQVISGDNIVYIDPSKANQGSGLYENPLNSVEGIQFETDHVYLIKRNTTSILDNPISINSSNVLITSYGDGELPVIESNSYDYLLTSTDRHSISVENIHFKGDYALSCAYFLGPLAESITLKNCIFDGADYGIRLINTGEVLVEHCQMINNIEGIFAIARKVKIYYNIFRGNEKAVNLVSIDETGNLFNNVFYDNEIAVETNAGELYLNNNIFSLISSAHRAIISENTIHSDYNIYYPVQNNFITIGGNAYNSLDDIREAFETDINSMVSDPEFIDPLNNNFHLGNASPAIDAGKYLGLIYDINGNPIPYGKAPDIGAMELTSVVSVEDVYSPGSDELYIFPNPASDYIQIRITSENIDCYRVHIYDIMGKLLQNDTGVIPDENGSYTMDIQTLKNGIYYIRVSSNNRVFTGRFIKN